MKTVKIKKAGAGKWADPNTNIPQVEVVEGDVVEVTNELADIMCPNSAKDITADLAKEKADKEKADKEKADKEETPATKDKGNAESK